MSNESFFQFQRDVTEAAPRWHFNALVDLEHWLACVTTDPCQHAQDNKAYALPEHLVCAFAKGFEPRLKHAVMMAASKEMLSLLQQCRQHLPATQGELASQLDALFALVDGTPDVSYDEASRAGMQVKY